MKKPLRLQCCSIDIMTCHIVCVCTRWPPNTKSVPWLHAAMLWLVTMLALSGVDALPDMTPAQSMVWNVSYITISPLGIPQQVISPLCYTTLKSSRIAQFFVTNLETKSSAPKTPSKSKSISCGNELQFCLWRPMHCQ